MSTITKWKQLKAKYYGVCMIMLIVHSTAMAQIPPRYYNAASGLTGVALKNTLNDIINNHIEYPYTSSSTDVWDILKVADRDSNNTSNVIGIYSGFSMNGAAEYNGGSGWSREHVWPKSRGNFTDAKGVGTDVHHIRAEDVSTNSARANRNFDDSDTQYIDGSGSTNSYIDATNWAWEPRDEMKGDVARMIFYMTVRYEGENGELDLELTDVLLPKGDKSPFHGKASVLMQWHIEDPVSSEERRRNDIVYGYQNNRNPFIDHPEYVCLIYGTYCASLVLSLDSMPPKKDEIGNMDVQISIYPNPVKDMLEVGTQEEWMERVEMVNISGNTVIKKKCLSRKVLLDVGGLPKGIYFLKVFSAYSCEIKKVVVD